MVKMLDVINEKDARVLSDVDYSRNSYRYSR